jgi:hypothetical protein
MTKFVVYVAAIAAAVCVLAVLITPAPDELPSTPAHAFHYAFFFPAAVASLEAPIRLASELLTSVGPMIHSGTELLSLTCTRIC